MLHLQQCNSRLLCMSLCWKPNTLCNYQTSAVHKHCNEAMSCYNDHRHIRSLSNRQDTRCTCHTSELTCCTVNSTHLHGNHFAEGSGNSLHLPCLLHTLTHRSVAAEALLKLSTGPFSPESKPPSDLRRELKIPPNKGAFSLVHSAKSVEGSV